MLDDLELEQTIRLSILNLMVVLYDCGITEVHIGAVMRLLGIANERAEAHDNQRIVIDEDFVKYVDEINTPRPVDQTLH
jgi:hypothetical protein